MSEFEEWSNFNLGYTGQEAYEAGQQSKQVEVNRLNSVIDGLNTHHLNYVNGVLEAEAKYLDEIDSLKVQLSLQRDRNKALETELANSRNYGDSLHSQLNNMEQCYIDMKKERDDAVYLKNEHRKHRVQLSKKLTQKSLRLTDSEFEYKRIKGLQAKDCLQIMRLTARNEKLRNELKALRGDDDQYLPR